DVGVALVVAGANGVDGDLRIHRRRPVLSDNNRAAELLEPAAHLAHHQVTYRKVDRRVDGIDRPGPRAQLAGCGCSHIHVFLLRGAGLPDTFEKLNGLRSDTIPSGSNLLRVSRRRTPLTQISWAGLMDHHPWSPDRSALG